MNRCPTSYAIIGYGFSLLPSTNLPLGQIYFLLYLFLWTVIYVQCYILTAVYVYYPEKEVEKQTKAEKIKLVKVALCVLLFCVMVQHSILYYLILYMDSSSASILTTLKWTSSILGILSIFLACIIDTQSNGFFHPTDILNVYLTIGIFMSFMTVFKQCPAPLVMYVPVYVFVIKALLQVFVDSENIVDFSYHDHKDFIVFRTLSGKVYRGRLQEFFVSIYILLDDVEKRVGKNDWREAENEVFFWFNIIWVSRVPDKLNELQIV